MKTTVANGAMKLRNYDVNDYGVDYETMGVVIEDMLEHVPNDYYKELQLNNMKYSLKNASYTLDALVETLRCLTESKKKYHHYKSCHCFRNNFDWNSCLIESGRFNNLFFNAHKSISMEMANLFYVVSHCLRRKCRPLCSTPSDWDNFSEFFFKIQKSKANV